MEQVFPCVQRNTVRFRISYLKEQPGAEAYLQRLEDQWYELWMKNKGSDELPDKHPRNPVEFDLKAHLAFLRKHIDKSALLVDSFLSRSGC